MTFHELTSGYLWTGVAYSAVSIGWLVVRHRQHINPKVMQRAFEQRKQPDLPVSEKSRWNRDATLVGRISTVYVIGWVLVIFFGRAITTG